MNHSNSLEYCLSLFFILILSLYSNTRNVYMYMKQLLGKKKGYIRIPHQKADTKKKGVP